MQDQFFNKQKREQAILRAKKRADAEAYFMHEEAAQIIAERINVTNREFRKIGILFDGPHIEHIKTLILQNTNNTSNEATIFALPEEILLGDAKTEKLDIEPESFDLIISVFDLYWINDLPGVFSQINKALKPDGLFMAALPAEGTLAELNQSLVAAESEIHKGANLRVGPFAQIRTLGDLLRRAEFKLPVADLEQRIINYSNFEKLIADLRYTASNNTSFEKVFSISKAAHQKTRALYRENFSNENGKLTATLNLAFLSGWKEHASQQKPLDRGSAKNKLSDFL